MSDTELTEANAREQYILGLADVILELAGNTARYEDIRRQLDELRPHGTADWAQHQRAAAIGEGYEDLIVRVAGYADFLLHLLVAACEGNEDVILAVTLACEVATRAEVTD